MLKVKEFLVRYQLIDFVNSKEFTGKAISITTRENTAMSSPCIYELFYEECEHTWTVDIKEENHYSDKKSWSAICSKCGAKPLTA